MLEKQEVISKIEKLLKLGESPNEHEATSALLKARALMDTHQIAEFELKEAEVQLSADSIDLETTARRKEWITQLNSSLSRFNSIKIYYKVRSKKRILCAVGLPVDIQMFSDMREYLVEAIGKLATEEAKQNDGNTNAFKAQFCLGASHRIGQRLAEILAEQEAQAETMGSTLVIVKADLIRKAMAGISLSSGTRSTYVINSAYIKGGQAGNGISLNSQLN
jgi:hypothetical protein